MSLAVVCHVFLNFQSRSSSLVLTRRGLTSEIDLKNQVFKSKKKTSRAFCCAACCSGRLNLYTQTFCFRYLPLQTALASDLGEGLAVLAGSLGHDLLRHADAVLALQAGVGQPVTEVLL